jgi:hypothetical protein
MRDATIAVQENEAVEQVSAVLAKMEGRPVMLEEYQVLSQFVDRGGAGFDPPEAKGAPGRRRTPKDYSGPDPGWKLKIPLEELGISCASLRFGGAGYTTVGDLMLQIHMDSDQILGLSGIGPSDGDIEAAWQA